MKIWMPPQKAKNRFAVHTLAGISAILALAFLMIAVSALLTISAGENGKVLSLFLCLLTTAVIVLLALQLGRILRREATLFCQDDSGRLYVLDVRRLVRYQRGFIGMIQTSSEVQKLIPAVRRQIEQEGMAPTAASEILGVERITERSGSYSVVCRVHHPNGHTGRYTCVLVKGYEQEDLLLYMLERKRLWRSSIEPKKNRNFIGILISLIFMILCSAVCIFSHPNVGVLPRSVYFPCLGIDMAAVYSMIYFIVRHRRGE